MEELEQLDDIRIFDQAKKEDDGERISAEEVFRTIEEQRKKKS